jgi:Rrf2 family protein
MRIELRGEGALLSKKAKYGLRALIAMGRDGDGRPMLIADLARRERIPLKYLEQILLELKKHGVVHSKKGKGGGYQLGRDPREIAFSEVLRILDGPLALTPCVSETAYRRCDDCLDVETCGIRVTMKHARDAVVAVFDRTTLAAVIAREKKFAAAKK